MDWKQQIQKGIKHWIELCGNEQKYQSIKSQLKDLQKDHNDELTVMVAGEFNAGKSTFINALLGQKVVSSDVTPETAMVTKLTYGKKRKIIAHFLTGEEKVFNEVWLEQLTAEREGKYKEVRRNLSHVELQMPIDFLKTFTIIDTPGLNANNKHHTEATERFLKRADIAIWLFHFMNVGTSTDKDWLKKFLEFGIQPVGIVNRIDEMNDEDDDLDEFLEFHESRLHPVVTKLVGVSAKEALTGKLKGDAEMLKWSNWEEIDRLFKGFKELENKKLERTFQRLQPLVRELDQLLLIEKLSLPIALLSSKVSPFMTRDYPKLVLFKDQLEESLKETKAEAVGWKNFLNRGIYSVSGLDVFIQDFHQHFRVKKPSVSMDSAESIQPQYDLFYERRKDYQNNVIELNKERDTLDSKWRIVIRDTAYIFMKRKLDEHKNQLDFFNRSRERLAVKRKELMEEYNQLTKKVKSYNQDIRKLALDDFNSYVKKQDQKLDQYNKQLEKSQKAIAPLKELDMDKFHQFSNWLYTFLENVAAPFHQAGLDGDNCLAYEEVAFMLHHFTRISEELPSPEFYKLWNEFKTYKKEQSPTYDIVFPELLPPEIRYSEITYLPAELKHDLQSEYENYYIEKKKWFLRGVAVIFAGVIGTGVYASNRDDTSPAYGEMESYEDDYYAEDYEDYSDSSEEDAETAKQMLAEKFREAEISAYLHQMNSELQSGIYNHGEWFTDAAWYDYSSYSGELHEGKLLSLEVTDIEYLSGESLKATVTEVYSQTGYEKSYVTAYVFEKDYMDSLRVSEFSYTLGEEKEIEIALNTGELEQFLADFRQAYFNALNSGDSTNLLDYLEAEGKADGELTDYVGSIEGKGFTFEETDFSISGTESIGTNQYKVSTFESFIFTDDKGEKTNYERTKDYLIRVLPESGPVIQEVIINDTKKEKVIVSTVHLVNQQEVSYFITDYYSAFEIAFNGSGFGMVESYYDSNDPAYESTRSYIDRAIEKNMFMGNLDFVVESVSQMDEEHYLVTVFIEDEYSYQDGTGDIKKIRASYKVRITTEGDMLVTGDPEIAILEKITK